MMPSEFLVDASLETLAMVFAAATGAACLGLPLGVLLFVTRSGQLAANSSIQRAVSFLVNTVRSVPFIILLVAMIPFTRFLVGTSIGTLAAIVPLTLAAIPFFARLVENALAEVPSGLVEAGEAMGASTLQVIGKVLIPEALPGIVAAMTLTCVNLVGYSAMAGTIGGGGLGDLAIRFGYQRFDGEVMFLTVVVLVVMVQGLQWLGDRLVAKLRKG